MGVCQRCGERVADGAEYHRDCFMVVLAMAAVHAATRRRSIRGP